MGVGFSNNGGGTPQELVFIAVLLSSGRDAAEQLGGKYVSSWPAAVRCCVLGFWGGVLKAHFDLRKRAPPPHGGGVGRVGGGGIGCGWW